MIRRTAEYEAVIPAPFGRVGVRTEHGRLVDIGFLPPRTTLRPPRDAFARRVCRELTHYFADPCHPLELPLAPSGSEHARRVWRALQRIPPGDVRSYGELARRLKSSPRAIGGACRANPIPIVIPCHRIVAASGVGGFMGKRAGSALAIKRWLLDHEQR
jgi:methylated-DNA-[protein]-cysteine S-methyltransferase